MTQARLPDGFAVQVDRRVRVLGQGSALLGGSPTRILRLAPAAQDMLADGRLKVRDAVSVELAGLAMPHAKVEVAVLVRADGPAEPPLLRQ